MPGRALARRGNKESNAAPGNAPRQGNMGDPGGSLAHGWPRTDPRTGVARGQAEVDLGTASSGLSPEHGHTPHAGLSRHHGRGLPEKPRPRYNFMFTALDYQ